MKICFVTTLFPRYIGDSEGPFIWGIAHAVANAGHEVRVIAQHWPSYPKHEWMDNVEVIRPQYWWPESAEKLRQPGGGIPIAWQSSRLVRLQMIPFILIHTLAVARYARGYDVVHAQWTLSAGAAWLSRMIHQRPVLATLQGSDIFQVTRNRFGAWLTNFVLQRCNRISVLSPALAEATMAVGISEKNIKIIPNGVDVNQFQPASEERKATILYVGSLIERKGVSFLIKAMPKILEAHPQYRLVIVGEGVERERLQALAQELGVAEQINFAGAQPSDQVRHWMQRSKIFVLPSVEEGLGVVLLEALASGTPVVASEVGGIPTVITPEVGHLVPPGDADALAQNICRLLTNNTQWSTMSQQARHRAEEIYDWQKIAAQFIEIYDDMVQ